jgi:hypothetical protein
MSRIRLIKENVFNDSSDDFSWNLFYAEINRIIDTHNTVDFSNFKNFSTSPFALDAIYIYSSSDAEGKIDLAHALLHATCTTKDEWKNIPNRWKVVELLINSGADFTATSGVFFKEYAIDRMIAGNAPAEFIALALKKGAWIGRNKNLLEVINRDCVDAGLVRLKEAVSKAVGEIAADALKSELAKHRLTPISAVCQSVVAHVRAKVARYFGQHSEHDIIGVMTKRVIDAFNQRYVSDLDQKVINVVKDIRFHESIEVSKLVNDLVCAQGDLPAFTDDDRLVAKRKLLRQLALRFVDEKIDEVRRKNPQAHSDVIINDLVNAFKLIVQYDKLEKCVQLDVENALKERVQNTFNSTQNSAVASSKTASAVLDNKACLLATNSATLFGGSRGALATPPQRIDNNVHLNVK